MTEKGTVGTAKVMADQIILPINYNVTHHTI